MSLHLCECVCMVHHAGAAGASGSMVLWLKALYYLGPLSNLLKVGYRDTKVKEMCFSRSYVIHIYFVAVTWAGEVTTMSLPQCMSMRVCVFVHCSCETSPW